MEIDIQNAHKVVINLPQRRDRIERFNSEIVKLFNSNDVVIVDGVMHHRPFVGIATAHLNAIQKAKDLCLPHILIMEDDLWVQSASSREKMESAFREVPEDFEILLGGIYTGQPVKKTVHWDSVNEFSALHFYVVNSSAYDRILSFDKCQHIDRWLGKPVNLGGCGLRSYVANPFFCIQHPGYSDNTQKDMDYSHLLKKYKVLK